MSKILSPSMVAWVILLAGRNTVKGLGRVVRQAGAAIKQTAERAKS